MLAGAATYLLLHAYAAAAAVRPRKLEDAFPLRAHAYGRPIMFSGEGMRRDGMELLLPRRARTRDAPRRGVWICCWLLQCDVSPNRSLTGSHHHHHHQPPRCGQGRSPNAKFSEDGGGLRDSPAHVAISAACIALRSKPPPRKKEGAHPVFASALRRAADVASTEEGAHLFRFGMHGWAWDALQSFLGATSRSAPGASSHLPSQWGGAARTGGALPQRTACT